MCGPQPTSETGEGAPTLASPASSARGGWCRTAKVDRDHVGRALWRLRILLVALREARAARHGAARHNSKPPLPVRTPRCSSAKSTTCPRHRRTTSATTTATRRSTGTTAPPRRGSSRARATATAAARSRVAPPRPARCSRRSRRARRTRASSPSGLRSRRVVGFKFCRGLRHPEDGSIDVAHANDGGATHVPQPSGRGDQPPRTWIVRS